MKKEFWMILVLACYCVWLQMQLNFSNTRLELAKVELMNFALELAAPPVGSHGVYMWVPRHRPDDSLTFQPNYR